MFFGRQDSFCVEDASDLSTSSTANTSAQRTSDERPSKPSRKRKRIKSPLSSDSSDSPGDQFRRKCFKAKTSLDFFWPRSADGPRSYLYTSKYLIYQLLFFSRLFFILPIAALTNTILICNIMIESRTPLRIIAIGWLLLFF